MKKLFLYTLLCVFLQSLFMSCNPYADSKFTPLFNGENLDGWYPKIRSNNDSLAKKVFAVENGMVHIFNDEFPDKYELYTGENNTHGLFYTNKEYSRFIFRFEYKWGTKIANNYDQFQYDAGCYYHVVNDNIWPTGVEYQVRYNDSTNENHTGDFWTGHLSSKLERYVDADRRYLPESEGGIKQESRTGELRAAKNATYHGLDGQWNKCEVIVMADKYSIHKLNGEIVNIGTKLGIKKGKIGLQSETGEIFYRNISILEFDEDIPMSEFIK